MSDLASLQGSRILVVEDDQLIADDVVEALKAQGAEICGPIQSLPAALDWIFFFGNHVVGAVLDINLNGSPSWPIADALSTRNIPFVVVSGFIDQGIPDRYAAIPRCPKPCDPKHLLSILAREVSLRQRQIKKLGSDQ